jgi:hypothetical protein
LNPFAFNFGATSHNTKSSRRLFFRGEVLSGIQKRQMTEQEIEAGIELLKALKVRPGMTLSEAIKIDPGCSERSWLNIVQHLSASRLIEYHWNNGTIRMLPAGIEYSNRRAEE